MAAKSTTDQGATRCEIRITRDGASVAIDVTIYDAGGRAHPVSLSPARVAALLSSAQEAALADIVATIYAGALADGGWT